MKESKICKIIQNVEVAENIFDMLIDYQAAADTATPGQFLHIKCPSFDNLFLRRPISICEAVDGKLRIIYEVRGKGTKSLSMCRANDELDVLGPLGRGFEINNELYKAPMIIGGGIGTFPLYNLTKAYGKSSEVLLGFRDKSRVLLEEEFSGVAKSVVITTDDGSYGYHGFATNLLEEKLKNNEGDILYACGPIPMLKIVKALADKYNIKAQISLEQRMGCGIGACLTCSCETVFPGTWKYQRVCLNGPVFWANEVTLND